MASLLERDVHSFDKNDLLACSRGELFGPGNSQLPAPNMLMFDRITDIQNEGGDFGLGYVKAELDINENLWRLLRLRRYVAVSWLLLRLERRSW